MEAVRAPNNNHVEELPAPMIDEDQRTRNQNSTRCGDSQAPTAVPTPTMQSSPAVVDKDEKFNETSAHLTATNTIDSLTLGESGSLRNKNAQIDLSKTSTTRKILLLSMFTLAEFLDAFNNSALFPAIPIIAEQLSFDASETVWIVSAYQLTFAAFLLVSGRISDVYTPKPAFIAGCLVLGGTHLIGGFMHQKIALLVLRALGGIGGALTIPSALSLIVQLFPDPSQQARAISLFGSAGAIGNVLGILIGAVLVQYASWSWIFWFTAIIGMGISTICFFLIPNAPREKGLRVKFDAPGVSLLTVAVILFIFAVTSSSTIGWGTAYVLAPFLISLILFVLFLFWEAYTPPDDAVLPPRMWRYRNFGVLVGLALFPYLWWVTSFLLFTAWWEQMFGWTALNTAVHFLPIGIGAGLASNITGRLPKYFAHKYILTFGLMLGIVATILQPFGDSPDTYWPFVFPSFALGTVGLMIIYADASIAVFHYTPPSVAGTVGAVFNCALQLGSAVGIAAVSSITTSVDAKVPPTTPPVSEFSQHLGDITKDMWKAAFQGRAASFWFLLAVTALQLINVIIFFKVDIPEHHEDDKVEKNVDVECPRGNG